MGPSHAFPSSAVVYVVEKLPSAIGRQSADGFIRGEGCGAMSFRVSSKEDVARRGCIPQWDLALDQS